MYSRNNASSTQTIKESFAKYSKLVLDGGIIGLTLRAPLLPLEKILNDKMLENPHKPKQTYWTLIKKNFHPRIYPDLARTFVITCTLPTIGKATSTTGVFAAVQNSPRPLTKPEKLFLLTTVGTALEAPLTGVGEFNKTHFLHKINHPTYVIPRLRKGLSIQLGRVMTATYCRVGLTTFSTYGSIFAFDEKITPYAKQYLPDYLSEAPAAFIGAGVAQIFNMIPLRAQTHVFMRINEPLTKTVPDFFKMLKQPSTAVKVWDGLLARVGHRTFHYAGMMVLTSLMKKRNSQAKEKLTSSSQLLDTENYRATTLASAK